MPTVVEHYIRRHPRSAALYEEAKHLFPGGVTHDTRYLTPFPVVFDHAAGSRKWDVDGNAFIDYVCGHGALLLGHGHPQIVAAVQAQAARGTHLGGSTELELRWAGRVTRLVPSVRKVRFHSSGTEAVMMAIRLARAFTGRERIIMYDRHFHGWYDGVAQGPPEQRASGITTDAVHSVLRLPFPDAGMLEAALAEQGEVAAVMLEPTGARMGAYPLDAGELEAIREVTRRHDVLLIFDEVVTGFRVSPGGAQQRTGVMPDLTILAKILGGGLPGGAVGGRSDVLDMISFHEDPAWDTKRRVAHQGTFNANPLSAAAGIQCLDIVAGQPVNAAADAAAARLRTSLEDMFRKRGFPAHAYGDSSLIRVLLGVSMDTDPGTSLDPQRITEGLDPRRARCFRQAMMNNGVDVMNGNLFIVSAAHGEQDIDASVDACEAALAAMRAEGTL